MRSTLARSSSEPVRRLKQVFHTDPIIQILYNCLEKKVTMAQYELYSNSHSPLLRMGRPWIYRLGVVGTLGWSWSIENVLKILQYQDWNLTENYFARNTSNGTICLHIYAIIFIASTSLVKSVLYYGTITHTCGECKSIADIPKKPQRSQNDPLQLLCREYLPEI